MIFEDFLYDVVILKSQHPDLRVGQALMIKLWEYDRRKYFDMTDTTYDCFYIESLVPKTLNKLKEEARWEKDWE